MLMSGLRRLNYFILLYKIYIFEDNLIKVYFRLKGFTG